MPIFDALSTAQLDHLVYLAVLGSVLTGYLLISMRGRVHTMLRHAVLWALLITGVAAAYGLWDNLQYSTVAVQSAEGDGVVLRRGYDGQYHLTLELTGPSGQPHPVRFIIDTGASDMVLTREDAFKLGFGPASLQYLGTARTANGVTRTAQVTLDQVTLQGHVSQRVRALVNEGDLHASLLGMGYLERFARIEIMRDRLRIVF
ncbi:retropepsin-like aspartic protease family protein [Pararhodobacter oceanensis]|uniref:retropepsin-like aspartic protease family protein n=1 Tax=Pararhodobacter oceanensis TaxID=2172121 RepID=UPI003A90DD9A